MEETLVLIKPDGVLNKKVGKIINRFEDKGLKIKGMKMVWIDEEMARKHYNHLQEKVFFDRLLKYITEAPVIAMVICGKEAIEVVRTMAGETNPLDALPGTIRGDFALDIEDGNMIHTSDSKENAEREKELFFLKDEIFNY
ncbi:nucleoside-diphosphate kinase [Halonatronum saccharophilum]|uniref:nucleoside-diphosphate kinase n=1 Tax=Halonatronum saccharophilum TaxID=150060 RepID=UPI00048A3C96|nr:nucleoside-diphosphate kinase [Halonatronum saccharophilum]